MAEFTNRTKRPLPRFYKIYFTVLGVFVLTLIIGAAALYLWLASYNETLPETISQKFFENTFVQTDTDAILSLSGIAPSEFETQDHLRRYITDTLSANELSYTSISTGTSEGEKKYIVKAGDYKVADFVLVKNQENHWEVSDIRLYLPSSASKSYKILDSTSLTINGKPVSDSYITKREPHKNAAYLPDGVPAPVWVTYTITGLTAEPVAALTDRNGNAPVLAADKSGILCEQVVYDQPEEALIQRLVDGAKQYAKCMQNDTSKASVYPYFEKGTDLYESIRTSLNMFVWDHAGYAFEDLEVTEFFRYDPSTVSVRIGFTHILKKNGSADYRDFTDITYFARLIGNEYKIFARHNN